MLGVREDQVSYAFLAKATVTPRSHYQFLTATSAFSTLMLPACKCIDGALRKCIEPASDVNGRAFHGCKFAGCIELMPVTVIAGVVTHELDCLRVEFIVSAPVFNLTFTQCAAYISSVMVETGCCNIDI